MVVSDSVNCYSLRIAWLNVAVNRCNDVRVCIYVPKLESKRAEIRD